ncbi:hypothetical protein MAUB1S_08134 [Mycolicibacterium aubagnense]
MVQVFVLDDVAACGQRAARLRLAFRAGLAVCIALFCLLASSPAAFSQSATLTISPATYTGAGVTMTYSIRITPGSVNIRSINATSSNIKGVPITCDAIPPSGFVIPFNCRGSYVTTATDNTTGQFGDNIRFTGTRTGGNFDFTTNYATATKQGGGGTSTSVSSSPNPALPGQTVLIRARVSSMGCDGGQAPSGSVKITVGPQSTTAGLNYSRPDRAGDSYADFSTATLPVGNHAVTAEFLGNAACDRSTATGSNLIVNTRPNVTINNAAGQASPTGAAPVNFTAVFERAVTGFSRTGVQLSGTAGATTATVSGSGTTYTIAVSGMTRSGTVVATIPEGVANASGLTNLASTSTSNSVDFVVISVSPGALPNAAYNTSYAQTLSASGGTGPYGFAFQSGALPTGMSISNGQVSGTPTQSGTFNFVVRATDANAVASTQAFSLVVTPPTIAVTPPTLTAATVGLPYSQTLSASGAIALYRFTRTGGALPAGLQLDEQSGTISGTPTAGGSFGFTVTAADANNQTGARAYTLTVDPAAIVLPATTLANGIVGTAYSAMINPASGGTAPYTYAVTGGALPSGMALGSAGQISGTTATPGVYDFTVTARDGSTGTGPYTGTRSYRLTITDTPPVANPASATVAYGSDANAVTLSFGGGVATSVAVASPPAHGVALPSGTSITYQPAPGYAGPDSFTYTASNEAGPSAPATVSITVTPPVMAVAPTGSLSAQAGRSFTQTFTFTGGAAPYTQVAVTGLPAGLAVSGTSANGVTISGTPSEVGSFQLALSATDASTGTGPFPVSGNVTLQVAAPALTLSPAGGAIALRYGETFSQAFTASGGSGSFSYALSGALPAGMAFSGGTLSGTPRQPGTYPISIVATDGTTGSGAPFSVSNSYSLTVAAPNLGITPGALTDATAGASYSVQLSADGGVAPYGYVLQSGRLPNGLTLVEGLISGTPTEAGSFPLTVQATDAFGQSVSIGYVLEVRVPALSLAPASLPPGTAGTAYSQTISATGGIAPYRYALSGNLPSGLSFDPVTGELRGTPTQAGSFAVSIEVTDSTGGAPAKVTQAYTLVVATPALTVTPASLPPGTAGTAYSQTISATGGIAPYGYTLSGSLPSGLGFDPGTGELRGTPTQAGSFTISVEVTDSTGGTPAEATQGYTLVVATPEVRVTPSSLPGGLQGTPYAATIAASGGIAPYTYQVSGNLPGGVGLDGTTGVLSGTPDKAGTFSISVTATDSTAGTPGTRTVNYSLVIADGVPTVSADTAHTMGGKPVDVDVTKNDAGSITSIAISRAPANGTTSISGFVITYTPAATFSGTDTFDYVANGPGGASVPATVTVTVDPLPVPASQSVSAVAGQPTIINLARMAAGGPFKAATLISVAPENAGTAALNGFDLNFTPDARFGGSVTVTYTLTNDFATSAPATVTIAVQPRIDPTTDPEVTGVMAAQAQAAQRFATSQVSNFQQRLDGLHDDDATQPLGEGLGFVQGITLGYDTVCRPPQPDCALQAKPDLTAPFRSAFGDAAPVSGRRARLTLWTAGSIAIGKGDGDAGYEFKTTGLSTGIDYRLNHDLTLGMGFGYGRDDTDIGDKGSRSKGESYTSVVYASYHPGDVFFIDGLAGYQWLNFNSLRYVTQNGNFVTGSLDGGQWLASISAGARLRFDQWRVTPYGRLDVAKATLGAYTEAGDAIYALRYGEQDISSKTGNIGVTLDYRYPVDFGSITPKLRLEYQHDFESSSSVVVNYADIFAGPGFTASAAGTAKDRFLLGLGLDIQTMQDLSLRLEYRGLFGNRSNASHGFAINAGARF